ncbi:MAG: CHAD domain-containing protein [Actinomycetota bacterium]
MDYALGPDEELTAGVRRIGHEQLDRAIGDLAEPERLGLAASVHDARKACKELRGLLRLVRPGLGRDRFREANDTVRDAARELSPLRDAQALVVTFDALVAADGGALGRSVLATRRMLTDRAGAADRAVSPDHPRLARALELLATASAAVESWDAAEADVAPGIAKTYGRARRAMRAAEAAPTDDALHEWRKRAKYCWYHARLLEPSAPSILAPLAQGWHDLSDALGDDHDLAVLHDQLVASPDEFGGAEEVAAVCGVLAARRADLQRRALGLGARLLAEEPAAYSGRLAAYRGIGRERGAEPLAGEIGAIAPPSDGLDDLTVAQLRARARAVDLPGRSGLRRDDLLGSLRAAEPLRTSGDPPD